MNTPFEVTMQNAHDRLETLRRDARYAVLTKESSARKPTVSGRGLRVTLTFEWTPVQSSKI